MILKMFVYSDSNTESDSCSSELSRFPGFSNAEDEVGTYESIPFSQVGRLVVPHQGQNEVANGTSEMHLDNQDNSACGTILPTENETW